MRLAVVVFAAVTPALAIADSSPCNVRIVRAPESVRAAIEARIGIEESSCTTLAVRVIPTRDGYYVIATPPHGESYEGNVRDPGLVGELVTGWARLARTTIEVEDEHADFAPAKRVAVEPPSAAPVTEVRDEAPRTARARSTRDLALGALVTSNGYGLRGEVDVIAGAGFSLAIAIGASTADWSFGGEMTSSDLTFRDIRALGVIAKTFEGGQWRLRAQAGFGYLHTQYAGTLVYAAGVAASVDGEGSTRMVEAALSASRDVGAHWAMSLGPMVTYYGQTYHLDDGLHSAQRSYDVGGYFALRRRL